MSPEIIATFEVMRSDFMTANVILLLSYIFVVLITRERAEILLIAIAISCVASAVINIMLGDILIGMLWLFPIYAMSR